MDDKDFLNNDDRDLFSYDNSGNLEGSAEESFDLNSFSSHSERSEKAPKKGRKKKKGSRKERIIRVILTLFLVGIITVSIIVSAFMLYAFTMVDGTMEENLNDLKLNFTTTVYVDDGSGNYVEYQRLHGMFNRIWVPYNEKQAKAEDPDYDGIPQTLANAFVAIEDKRFMDHNGVDWKRTFAAFANMFLHFYSSNQGGSTITQQLVKNLTGDTSQRPSRKIREIMRARYLETHYSKETILECYLNTIPMGHGTYGVEVAANYYFDKSVQELTLAECACLAAITKSPTYYAPDDYPEENKTRRNTVLYEMYDQGYITKEEYEAAKAEELNIIASKDALKEDEINSYFIDALIDQVTNDLCKKYGYEPKRADMMFYNNGYKIYVTLDTKIQETLETVFEDVKTYGLKGADGSTLQGSMTVMDYNGHVKGIVGGIGEKTVNRGLNRATDAIRQPGSTMKPLAAYAPAIEKDLIHYSSIVNDTKTNYNGWTPVNWYNTYWGNITVQYALERSVNTIPVYLVNKLGTKTSFDFLTKTLGITTLTGEDVNLSPLGMGGTNGGITSMESAAAFAIFGNLGQYHAPTLYTKVTDQHGETVLEYDSSPTMAISEDTATVMNHLLQTVVYGANGTGKGAASTVKNMKIYAKTGTSNNQNDLWFVGGTPYYVASCWCGYDQQQKIPNSTIAQKMWSAVMSKIHSGLEAKQFEDSSYATERYYCTKSGDLATSACPSKAKGWYKQSNTPGYCTQHSGTALGTASEVDKQEAEASKEQQSSSSSSSSSASSSSSSSSGSSSSQTSSASSEGTSAE